MKFISSVKQDCDERCAGRKSNSDAKTQVIDCTHYGAYSII